MERRNSVAVVLAIAILALSAVVCVLVMGLRAKSVAPAGGGSLIAAVSLPRVVERGVYTLIGVVVALVALYIFSYWKDHKLADERLKSKMTAAEKVRNEQLQETLRRREDRLREWLGDRTGEAGRQDLTALRGLMTAAREFAGKEPKS